MLGNNAAFAGIDDDWTDAAIAASATAGRDKEGCILSIADPSVRPSRRFSLELVGCLLLERHRAPQRCRFLPLHGLLGNATTSAAQGRLYTDTIMEILRRVLMQRST